MWRRRPLLAACPRLVRHAATSLASFPSVTRLAADLTAAASAFVPAVDETAPEPWGGGAWRLHTRCERRGAPLLLRRPAGGGPETVVLDAGAVAAALGGAAAVRAVTLSPCGGAVAVVVDGGGGDGTTEGAVVRVADQRVIARLAGATSIEFTGGGAAAAAASLLYVAADADGRPARAVACDGFGRDPRTVYEEGDASLSLFVGRSKDGALATLTSAGPAAAAVRVLTTVGGRASTPVLVSPARSGSETSVETFVEHWGPGGGMIALTNAAAGDGGGGGGPDYRLAAVPAPGAPPSAWTTLVPTRADRAIVDVDVFEGGVLLYERDARTGAPAASVLAPSLALLPVAWPPAATVVRGGTNADATSPFARVVTSSPLSPPTPVDVCLATGAARALPRPRSARGAAAAATAAAAGLTVASVVVGDDVRVTVVAPKTVGPASSAPPPPTLLTLYGAYGAPLDPDFDPVALALASRRGWRLAWAHVRGGGDRGRAWHAAGRGAARGAALADAHAALTWARGGHGGGGAPVALAAESAGALLAAALLTARPADVAAVALRSPFLDVSTPDALTPGEAGEWAPPGAPASALAAVCPLALLAAPAAAAAAAAAPRGGPPVLIQIARGDTRAPAASAARWAAALRRARAGVDDAAPVVLHLCDGGWHGAGGPGGEEGLALDAEAAAFCAAAVEGGV